jgi:polyisoprenoid-binding protein YceI
MKTSLSVCVLAFVAAIAAPACAQQKLLAALSEISFTSRQMGVPVDGRFKTFDAQIQFDPKNPEAGNVAFSIDVASAAIGDAETMAELAKPAWFDSKRFPRATFQSTRIRATGPGKIEVTGKLAIKGRAQEVRVPASVVQTAGQSTANGSFVIKRLDFRIGDGDWADTAMVANDVLVKFRLALSGIGTP